MTEKVFFDTNIYIYLFSQDPQDELKGDIARKLLAVNAPVVSAQVLQEFVSASLKKKRLGITEEKIDLLLELTASFPFQPLSHALLLQANTLRRRYGFFHWDSTMIAAAYAHGCSTLYSEDLQHGFTLDHLTIINPF